MSSIKLQGNANGTGILTIEAPDTNTDRSFEIPDTSGTFAMTNQIGRRNLIINGAMQVAQRGTSTGKTTSGYGGPDRFQTILSSAGTWDVSQSSTSPDGFSNSFKLDCTTADASLSASDYLVLYYTFEGYDLQRLKKGTSAAEKSTLSFWIRSNKTGTYQVNMADQDNSRIIGSSYTIDAADTWEHKVITFDGDTTGAYTNDANASMNFEWWFAAGSTFTSGAVPTSWEANTNADRAAALNVNLADSTSNELYITGVQLEVGSVATPFEHRSYGEELALCQRYYQRYSWRASSGLDTAFSLDHITIPYLAPMRATPGFHVFDWTKIGHLSGDLSAYAPTAISFSSGGVQVEWNSSASGYRSFSSYRATGNIGLDAEL